MAESMLVGRGLGLSYGGRMNAFTAVDGADFAIENGRFIAIVGPSGSGKSSLLYLLSGLRRATRGSVTFKGVDYDRLGSSAVAGLRREHFGFIFQQHFLINYLGALENVLVGALRIDAGARRRATALLGDLGLGDKLRQRPYQLSVGERQRVAVARAMVGDPDIIFADEPTAALDQRTGHDVIAMLADYRSRGAVVVVTHDLAMTIGADSVLEMRDGRLAPPG
jgi:putative ABC transport system ATP-binding protein